MGAARWAETCAVWWLLVFSLEVVVQEGITRLRLLVEVCVMRFRCWWRRCVRGLEVEARVAV